ncbi:hypothetical protein FDT66_00875 [Polaribacter aestuariivivens]|uniref:DUF4136 domain-containing protein n=1 Tax=Polaribacter aestuariivivens TaxID=2304626 RepID=A0A5S3N9T7_9FLAO|nr:hypothetical protein [Polaribacter aestuariivivens]TMM32051.1 hypothetical protein FDT66_00875 [Polaribacter aestuariivivens]
MKRKIILVIALSSFIFNMTSCKVSKNYVQFISKKEDIVAPKTKKVLAFSTENVQVSNFTKTFDKNFTTTNDFTSSYLNDFKQQAIASNLFSEVFIDTKNTSYTSLKKENADYIIYFSNVHISNRVEWTSAGGMNMNGMGMQAPTSVEYCVVTVKVEVFDAKTDKEILDFVSIGEESVFLFDFTKTLLKAKERSINHIINFLQSGKTTYKKY